MVLTLVSKWFIPWDSPRLGVVGGLLPVGSTKSPAVVDVGFEIMMDCNDSF